MRQILPVKQRKIISLAWLGLTIAFLSACGKSTQVAAPNQIEDQLSRGAEIYARDCATSECHGTHGEGLRQGDSFRAWPLIGSDFASRNPDAQVIFDVVRSGSETNLRALSDGQIYDSIAYELSLNGISLSGPLNVENASEVASGQTTPPAKWGELFPPPANADLLPAGNAPNAPRRSTNESLALRVDQMALARRIGESAPATGGVYVILVLAFQNPSPEDVRLEASYLSLADSNGKALRSETVRLAYPIEAFHSQIIPPDHGTAAVAIFSLPSEAQPGKLVYQDPKMATIQIDLQN